MLPGVVYRRPQDQNSCVDGIFRIRLTYYNMYKPKEFLDRKLKFTSFYKQTSLEQTESRENESKFMMKLCRKFEDIIGALRKVEGDNSRKKKKRNLQIDNLFPKRKRWSLIG